MKSSLKLLLITVISSLALFVAGFYIYPAIINYALPIVGNVKYSDDLLGQAISPFLLFSLTLALIPIASILVWKFAPVYSPRRRVLTVCIILIAIALAIFSRREMIEREARLLQPLTYLSYSDGGGMQPKETPPVSIPMSTFKFEWFAFGGLIAGSVASFFSLRENRRIANVA